MFALLSVVFCPSCGEALPVSDIGFHGEPTLMPVTCSSCETEWQVRKDDVGGMIVEERKVS